MAVNVLSPCHVRETSPGTHTFFRTYTCPVYCWRSVQLSDFSLFSNLIHASQPIRTTFTGQCFASGFLQTPPHGDALAFGCILPTAGRIRDFHPLERALAGHTNKRRTLSVSRIRRFHVAKVTLFLFCFVILRHEFYRVLRYMEYFGYFFYGFFINAVILENKRRHFTRLCNQCSD